MRKYLLLTSMIVLSTGIASAKTIDFDTIVEWNSEVIAKALDKAGFIGSNGALWDVRVTHERILSELVEKQSFSLRDATRVCLDKCNISDFLKNGRGQSGRKCPELCSDFADKLVSVNNEYKSTGNITLDSGGLVVKQADGAFKIYSADKKYYAVDYGLHSGIKQYLGICKTDFSEDAEMVVFEANTNRPVALLAVDGEDGAIWTLELCAVGKYNYLNNFSGVDFFGVNFNSSISSDGMPEELFYDDGSVYKRLLVDAKENAKKLENVLQNVPARINSMTVKKYLREREYNEALNDIEKARGAIAEWNKTVGEFTEDSWENFDKLRSVDIAENLISDTSYAVGVLDKANKAINRLKQEVNGEESERMFTQTKTAEEAYGIAKKYVNIAYNNSIDESKVTCTSEPCKHLGNDKVTCSIGDVTYTVIFDDICQTEVEERLGNFFYNF